MASLLDVVQAALAAIHEVHKAFGAPGDYGYGTKEGDALFALYRAGNALQSKLNEVAGSTLSDWSNLPKDIYVIEAVSHDGIGCDVKCCSVPMVTAPEVRYTRADLVVDLPSEPTLAMQNAFEAAYWRKHAAGPDESPAVSDPFSEAYRAMLTAA